MLIDAHCHLDQYPVPEMICRECVAKRIKVVAVTNLPAHYALAATHLRGSPQLFPALGLHPLAVAKHGPEIAAFRRLAASTDFVGEIGLDFSREGIASRREQEAAFDTALATIADRPRFVSLHSRGAEKEVLEGLSRHHVGGAVFHWFSGSVAQAEEVAAAGHYLSINPAMLRTEKIERLLPVIPRDQILAETDGPHVMVAKRPAAPKDVCQVYAYLAQRWDMPISDVENLLASNFSKACVGK